MKTWKERIHASQKEWTKNGEEWAREASKWSTCACCREELGFSIPTSELSQCPEDLELYDLGYEFSDSVYDFYFYIRNYSPKDFEINKQKVINIYNAIQEKAKELKEEK